MATGRTHPRWARFYMAGYDLSGYSRTVGPLKWEYEEAEITAQMGDSVKGYLPGKASISCGTLNGVFDSTVTSGLHVIASSVATSEVVMIPIGIRAAPAAGDPVFMGEFVQLGYTAEESGGAIFANVPFGEWDVSDLLSHSRSKPWGVLIHAKAARTAANTAVGIDDYGAATALGGYMMYQIFAGAGGDGTATIKMQDAAANTNPSFADITGATTGELDCSTPQKGVVDLTATRDVRRYLRWQLALNGATTVTFAIGFCRTITAGF